jgi:hypothetical protein
LLRDGNAPSRIRLIPFCFDDSHSAPSRFAFWEIVETASAR